MAAAGCGLVGVASGGIGGVVCVIIVGGIGSVVGGNSGNMVRKVVTDGQ
jgi:hypothetical protein